LLCITIAIGLMIVPFRVYCGTELLPDIQTLSEIASNSQAAVLAEPSLI
jgi:hypothetical protein